MSKIFKTLFFTVIIVILIPGCKMKSDNEVKVTSTTDIKDIIPSPGSENTMKTSETPTSEPYIHSVETPIPEPSHNVEVNKIEYIGNYLGEWISQNNTEVIEDVEGSVIEDTDDDKKGHMEITLNEQNEPQVYIWMMSRISRTFEGTFKVAFDEKGTAIINDLDGALFNDADGEIKSIKIKLGHNRYSVSVDFIYDDKTVYMGFIRLDQYSNIARCMEIVRDINGVNSNKIDDGKYIIRYSGMDDDGIVIIISRVEDTWVQARYVFDPETLQYKVD